MEASFDDSVTMNNGSVVGLPNSSSDEEDSTDELTRAGDALCRTLLQEQDKKETVSQLSPKKQLVTEVVESVIDSHSNNNSATTNDHEEENQPILAVLETKSTSSPSTSEADETASVCVRESSMSLEERVNDLEAKLATLSRLLQQQQRLSVRSLLARSPTGSQRSLLQPTPNSQRSALTPRLPAMPLMEEIHFEGTKDYNLHQIADSPPSHMTQKGMVPYLESPAPIDESPRQRSLHQRKRLSFHLLYDGNEDNLGLADDDNDAAIKASIMESNNTRGTDQPVHPNGNDHQTNNSEQQLASQDTTHPLHKDTTNSENNNGNDHTNSSAERESVNEEENNPDGRPNDLSAVAASVVDSQMKTEQKGKEANINHNMESSNHSSVLMDESHQSKRLDGSPKKKPTTPVSSNGGGGGGGGGDSKDESTFSPSGGHIKPTILPPLPPLLVSKDTRTKWLDHLNSFQESNHDVDRQMQEFIKVPGAVENTLFSGLLICVDSFLYVWTILPIRFAWSCVLLSLHYFFKWTNRRPGNYQFHRRHMYQLLQVSILFFVYRYILLPISIGKLYHWIRGQAMIKLYVLIAIVEVFDRLMCSLGQDCLDSLYWNTTRRPRSSRMLISVSVVMFYTAVHSLILFVHVATLNVAMNSADEALLALLIAGNFAEIKSTVFKKYNKASLFKIVASDICERFKLALFLGLVLLLNFCQGMDSRKMSDYQRIAGIVWMSELLCDWLKHAFITKFNFIPSTVYLEYGLLLAGDVSGIGHEGVNLDHSHAVVKRIGFAQMPLVCVMARLVREAAKYMALRIDSQAVQPVVLVLASAGSWIILLILKILLGSYLQRASITKLHAAPELSQTPLKSKQK